jgi:trimeric autotransporter adhesin
LAACGDVADIAEVARVEVTPAVLALTSGEDSVVRVRVSATDGAPLQDRHIYWASANPLVASVSPQGIVTAVAPGTTRLAVSVGGKSAFVDVRVSAPPLAVVQVTPNTSGVGVGSTLTLKVSLIDAAGDTVAGPNPTWRSSAATIASVTAAGAVRGLTPGTASILATVNGVTGAAVIAVQPKAVAALSVTPATATRLVGQTVQMSAALKASDSTVITGRFVEWSSSAPSVATVSSTGLVTALGAGTAVIRGSSEGKSATATVSVSLVPVASLSVVPATLTLAVGRSAPLAALPLDSAGTLLGGRTISWTSATPTVATVAANGVVTGVAPGTARITATTGGRSASSVVSVTLIPVDRITLTPTSATIKQGATVQLTATLRDAAGNVLTGRSLTWQSGSSTIARVSTSGLVSGVGKGTVLIFAESEGKRVQASIVVQ